VSSGRGPGPLAGLLDEVERLDLATFAAIERTPTPALDRAMARLTRAADYSRLWISSAAGLAIAGGPRGRRATANGLACLAVTATVVNVLLKQLGRRRRPTRVPPELPVAPPVPMPRSASFPSGHSAAGFSFATGVGDLAPIPAIPLHALAALVAYSRVHTGVHYPADALAGSLLGVAIARAVTAARRRDLARSRG
jgi:membrane-associated phospholipid phosphatase